MSQTIGFLMMTYGSPETTEDIKDYLTNIRRGKPPGDELLEDFQQRYKTIGGSPLNEITEEQARDVAESWEEATKQALNIEPYVGMRYWQPTIAEAVKQMASDGIEIAVGLIMSPQYSPLLMKGYIDQLQQALENTDGAPEISLVKHWWEEPQYHKAVAGRINEALEEYPETRREQVRLLLTAHSIPKRTYEKDPNYIDQLKQTAERIAEHVDHNHWEFAYQSAGHTREEWLKPDMTDLFPGMVEEGYEDVLIAPFQFLADHLEILYDIDVAAKKQAKETGLNFKRIPSLNTYPPFIESIRNVCQRQFENEFSPVAS